jgi:hypothetical protein
MSVVLLEIIQRISMKFDIGGGGIYSICEIRFGPSRFNVNPAFQQAQIEIYQFPKSIFSYVTCKHQ